MEIKTKLAALLRRWAYALHPETPATLPPGYQVARLNASYNYALSPGEKAPDKLITRMVTNILTDELVGKLRQRPEWFNLRAEIAPVPGGLIEYSGSLYIGFIPKKTK